MLSIKRFRPQALFCALALFVCEMVSHPFAEMGVSDDWSYARTARILAATGHIVYNGWATAMVGWQLYPAVLFIKLFGPSYTSIRMSALLLSCLTVFLIQRTFVRCGITERNSTLGTLAIALCPLYMQLSVTFMTDIPGVTAVVLCLYGSLRAVQSRSDLHSACWITFAAVSNALVGSSRQIAWLGVLVMVPCTLWLLRHRRKPLIAGAVASVLAWFFIGWCLQWMKHQPYALTEHFLVPIAGMHAAAFMVRELARVLLETPFLIFAIPLAFLSQLRRLSKASWLAIAGFALAYALLAIKLTRHHTAGSMLEPLLGDWVTATGFYDSNGFATPPPVALSTPIRAILTALSLLSIFSVIALLSRLRHIEPLTNHESARLGWRDLIVIVGPFAAFYFAFLVPRSSSLLFDRYLLALMLMLAIILVRLYQDFIRERLPAATVAVVCITALYGICCTHDLFAFYRARVAFTAELQSAGISLNSVDQGFEANAESQLDQSGYIDDYRILNPPAAYVKLDPKRGDACDGTQDTPDGMAHLVPHYGLAFDPNSCAGSVPLPPGSYFRWLGLKRAYFFLVKFGPRKP